MHGGGHERGMRSGTLPTHQIVGIGECFRIAGEVMESEVPRIRALRDRLWAGLRDRAELAVNGDMEQRIANNLNLSIRIENCDALAARLTDIAVSSASACSSGSAMPSHVLQSIGAEGASTLRITVGRFTTDAEIDYAIAHVREKLDECQAHVTV
jgi:cysteine desulfurase